MANAVGSGLFRLKHTVLRGVAVAVCALGVFPARAQTGDANLALNPSFEAPVVTDHDAVPDGWSFFTSSMREMLVTAAAARSGTQSLVVAAQGTAGAHMGLIRKVAVAAGARYSFAAYFLNNKADPLKGTIRCGLAIEWLDASGAEVLRETSEPFDATGSRLRWTPLAVNGKAPPRAAQANFVISELDGPSASSGSCFVDDVTILRTDGIAAHSNRVRHRGAGYLAASSSTPRAAISTQVRR